MAAGTAWLFARPDMQNILDTLVIDEAGQMSLANVLAVAATADNLVLLGDPQQLAQPQKGVHPPGAQVSALDHLLGGHDTIAADRGILLDRTYRMHPHLAGFISSTFYDGRLGSAAGCRGQHLDAPGGLTGTGTRWIPVEHHDNASAASEEADAVAALVDDLLRGAWTDRSGLTRPLTLPDILIITPYNAQVARIRSRAPRGARVGTVDKFQGQEAAVVIYSMATSTAADAPHDIGFLYAGDRLNVAISRARCLAAVVASPALLDAPVRTPDQLKKVNALVAFTEIARTSVPAPRNSGSQTALAVPN